MAYSFDSTEDVWLYLMYHLEIFTMQKVFGTVDVLVIITSKNHRLNNISVSHRTFLFSRRYVTYLFPYVQFPSLCSFLHYLNASAEVFLGTNIQSLVLFVIITLAISLKLVSLIKWKKSGQNSKSWLQAKINYYNSMILLYFPRRSCIHRF